MVIDFGWVVYLLNYVFFYYYDLISECYCFDLVVSDVDCGDFEFVG